MATSADLREIFAAGRPLIEQALDAAEQIAALRDAASAKGLDWSQVKALLKATIQDERDESGDGKRVARIIEKAEFASAYASMLGLANMNENNFSSRQPYAAEKGECDAKLVETVAAGLQTETGRKVLVAALDVMIEAEEAHDPETGEIQESGADKEVRFPVSFSGEAGNRVSVLSSPAGSGSDEIPANYHEMDRATKGSFETGSEAAEKGREAIPAGPEGADLSHAGADESSAADGRYVEATVEQRPSATNSDDFDPSKLVFLNRKTMADYRPHCQRPDACGSSGLRHCYSCMKSAGLAEASAS